MFKTSHRVILENLLKSHLPELQGDTLDIGSKNRRYDSLLRQRPIAMDIEPDSVNHVIPGDIQSIPFPDERFDNVMAIEVLEYVANPNQAMNEVRRILKKNGILILSIPFLCPVHGDFARYTRKYIEKYLLADFTSYKITAIGNPYTIIADIVRNGTIRIDNAFLRWIFLPVYLPFLLLATLMRSRSDQTGKYISGYFIIARK